MPLEVILADASTVAARIAVAADIEAMANQIATNLRDGWEHGTAADARDFAPDCISLLILAEGDADLPADIRDRVRVSARRLIDALDQRCPAVNLPGQLTPVATRRR